MAADARLRWARPRHKHDLSRLAAGLRSHGGRHEQIVPIIVSHPLQPTYAAWLQAGIQNSDLHDVVLNGSGVTFSRC